MSCALFMIIAHLTSVRWAIIRFLQGIRPLGALLSYLRRPRGGSKPLRLNTFLRISSILRGFSDFASGGATSTAGAGAPAEAAAVPGSPYERLYQPAFIAPKWKRSAVSSPKTIAQKSESPAPVTMDATPKTVPRFR